MLTSKEYGSSRDVSPTRSFGKYYIIARMRPGKILRRRWGRLRCGRGSKRTGWKREIDREDEKGRERITSYVLQVARKRFAEISANWFFSPFFFLSAWLLETRKFRRITSPSSNVVKCRTSEKFVPSRESFGKNVFRYFFKKKIARKIEIIESVEKYGLMLEPQII